jgi:hypothetical protein
MGFNKFNTIYTNGCSHTAGGGLDSNNVKNLYKELHGISWGSERDVTYPKRLSNHFNCKLVDDSTCGSGAPRLIRKTYEYITKYGLENAKKTLFILQINTSVGRLDYYCKKINDYVIVNFTFENDGSLRLSKTDSGVYGINIVDSYSSNEQKYDCEFFKGEIYDHIQNDIINHYNFEGYDIQIQNQLLGLFSFFEKNGIEYYYGLDSGISINHSNINRRIDIDGFDTIHKYSISKKSTISEELNNLIGEGHPGYFGHKKFSEELIIFLEEKLKPTLWVFGDSYSTKSNPEIDPSSYLYTDDFRMKYFRHKGYFSKSYPEIISETYNINLINLATSSYSNDNIFQSFSEVLNQIKPNDILIFGWTYNSRFNLADENNKITNINIMVSQDHYIDKNLCPKTINEILYNRENYSIYYKWLSNNLKLINQMFNKNLIIHLDFSYTGNVDDYTTEFLKLITPFKSQYQTIKKETNDESFNGHFSEIGHQDLAKDIIKIINEKF